MEVALLNLDVGTLAAGQTLVALLTSTSQTWSGTVNWIVVKGVRTEALKSVDLCNYWGALIIPPGFSDSLDNATMVSPNGPGLSVEFVYDEGRAYSAVALLKGYVTDAVNKASNAFAYGTVDRVAPKILKPSFLLSPVSISYINLHPVRVLGHTLGASLFFFLLWLGAAMGVTALDKNFMFGLVRPANYYTKEGKRRHTLRMIFVPITIGLLFTFINALAAWSVIFAVSGPDAFSPVNAPSKVGPFQALLFLWYIGLCPWFINSLYYSFLRANVFSVTTSLTLVLLLVSSGSLFDYVQMPAFFKVGYALPMRYAIREMRFMFFGSMSQYTNINLVALSLWIWIPMGFFIARLYYKIRQAEKLSFY